MAKTNSIKKHINGEVIDADETNQNLENAGGEGGLIPYDATSHNRDNSGDEDIGSLTYPWGNIHINKDKKIISVTLPGGTQDQAFTLAEIMQFIMKTDTPASYSGQNGRYCRVNSGETAIEFVDPPLTIPTNMQVFTGNGTWTRPAGINKVLVRVWGGGGNGAAGSADSGGGGGGGGYAEGLINVSSNVTVLAGSGTNSFAGDTTIQATGGSGGSGSTGGAGGVGSGGTLNLTGANGANGEDDNRGGNGGGGANGGSGGGGGTNGIPSGVAGGAGEDGADIGGGGGGGGDGTSGGSGGSGANGLVIVYY